MRQLAVFLAVGGLLIVTAVTGWAMDGKSKPISYEIGAEVYYHDYEEDGVMEEAGPMYGLAGEMRWDVKDPFALRIQADGAMGQVDYESVSTGTVDDIDDFKFETRILGAYKVMTESEIALEPYVGFGYRFLRDELGGAVSTTGAGGYDRESNYFYLPIGIDIVKSINADWNVKFNVEYDVFLSGEQKSELGDFLAGLDTLTNDQEDGWGIRGSIQIVKVMERYDLVLEPFMRYWSVDQSETNTVTYSGTPVGIVGYEPANTTFETGAKIGLRF